MAAAQKWWVNLQLKESWEKGKRVPIHLQAQPHSFRKKQNKTNSRTTRFPKQVSFFFFSRVRLHHFEPRIAKIWPSPALVSLTNHTVAICSNIAEFLPLLYLSHQDVSHRHKQQLFRQLVSPGCYQSIEKQFRAGTYTSKGEVPEVHSTTGKVCELSSLV